MQAVVRTYTNKWTVRVEAFNSLCGSTAWQKWCRSHALPCSFFFWSTAACFKGTQPSSLCLIWMTSICRQFVEAEVRQQFQPHKINITGIPVNKIIHGTFKTHWQLWQTNNITLRKHKQGQTGIYGSEASFLPLQHKTWRNSCMRPTKTATCW